MSAGSRNTRDGQHGAHEGAQGAAMSLSDVRKHLSLVAPSAPVVGSDSQDRAKNLTPVSERVEGETVLGRISAMVAKGCPGPAMRGGCVREFGHEGEHMGEGEFIPYLKASLVEVQDGVSKLKAERDELLAALRMAVARPMVDLLSEKFPPAWLVAARAAIAKAEEGR